MQVNALCGFIMWSHVNKLRNKYPNPVHPPPSLSINSIIQLSRSLSLSKCRVEGQAHARDVMSKCPNL